MWRSQRATIKYYADRIKRKARLLNKPREIEPDIQALFPEGRQMIDMIDLGSGPFTTIGTFCKSRPVKITACDLIADELNKIMLKHDIVPIVPIQKFDMQNLGFLNNTFDVVHCRNAIDHIPYPNLAMKEMYRICKPNGWIYLKHYPNQGERRHRWNIYPDGNDCRMWKNGREFRISKYLPGSITNIKDNMVITQCQKTSR